MSREPIANHGDGRVQPTASDSRQAGAPEKVLQQMRCMETLWESPPKALFSSFTYWGGVGRWELRDDFEVSKINIASEACGR